MNPLELLLPDAPPRPSGVWACGTCGLLWQVGRGIADARQAAEHCCEPRLCRHCGAVVAEPYRPAHAACSQRARIEQAEKLDTWDGWVFWEGCGYQDGFFEHVGALVEWLEQHPGALPREDWPAFVFTCTEVRLPAFSTDRIVEECRDLLGRDADERLDGLDALQAALDEFRRVNAGVVSYAPDGDRMVRVPSGAAAP